MQLEGMHIDHHWHWQSDWNGDEVGFDHLNVVGLYSLAGVYVYINAETGEIIQVLEGMEDEEDKECNYHLVWGTQMIRGASTIERSEEFTATPREALERAYTKKEELDYGLPCPVIWVELEDEDGDRIRV